MNTSDTHGKKHGLLISFEGIEGAGKSTQIIKLQNHLQNQGFNVLTLREPGGTIFGESLRKAILTSEVPLHPLTEAHLFCSSRSQLLHEKIIPHLEKSKSVVLLDRFIDSSFVYQGYARGLGLKTIEELHSHYPLSIRPDITFYLHIDFVTSLQRQKQRAQAKDYFEKETQSFYNSLINAYLELCSFYPDRIRKIDATASEESIFQDLLAQMAKLMPEYK